MTFKEALNAIGFTYEEDEVQYSNIQCSCGGEIEVRGFFTAEVFECTACHKQVVDLFPPIPVSAGSCTVLNPKEYDVFDNRYWIAITEDGGVMYENK